ncbi:DUF1656 domain-containing protein [Novosphingobium sp. PASSN1]|uniref:DUF1656 domain-containing protein n=1 Tax=Novosphingobium sp. PASSN1 TaxID=2015561 RepID=UPI0025F33B95|nr:DUF1656 domain-containing protein [Novosphingobium sp. PASSN1]
MYIAAAPVGACLALVLTFALHRLLVRGRLYRWFWHPVLADTALFVIVWALMVLWLRPFLEATLP